jgi:hypothetical protein
LPGSAFPTDITSVLSYDGSAIKKDRDMKRLIIAITMVALLPASAYPEDAPGPATARTDKEKKQDAAIEKAYLEATKRSGNAPPAVKSDPWQAVRPAGDDSKTR